MPRCLAPILLALSLAPVAHAGARKIPEYDLSSDAATLKSAKQFSMTTKGAPTPYPKRVAIGMFAVRYLFKETAVERDQATYVTLKFGDAEYTQLTNQLYAQLKARLEAEGIEVVDREAVIATNAYQALKAEEETKGNEKRMLYTPTGMKNLPVFSGQPRNPGPLAGINAELGTDAVVAAFVSVGVCTVDPTKKTEHRSGTYACIKGDLTMPGFNLTWIGGHKGEGEKVKPAWDARLYKQVEMFDYGDKLTYDMALIADSSAMSVINNGFWRRDSLATDEASFVGGAGKIYDDLLAMAFSWWEKKMGKRRAAAGVTRGALGGAVPEGGDATLAADPPAPTSYPVPALPGEAVCLTGSSTAGPVVMRRALDRDGNRIIEDTVVQITGGAPYHGVAVYTVDGAGGTARDHGGMWQGTVAFEGDPWSWTGWSLDLTFNNAPTSMKSTYKVVDGGWDATSVVSMNGKEVAQQTQALRPADAATCEAAFSQVAPIEGAW